MHLLVLDIFLRIDQTDFLEDKAQAVGMAKVCNEHRVNYYNLLLPYRTGCSTSQPLLHTPTWLAPHFFPAEDRAARDSMYMSQCSFIEIKDVTIYRMDAILQREARVRSPIYALQVGPMTSYGVIPHS